MIGHKLVSLQNTKYNLLAKKHEFTKQQNAVQTDRSFCDTAKEPV